MTDEFLQGMPEQPVAVSLDAGGQWLLVDDLVRAEVQSERAERAHWARIREAFPPTPRNEQQSRRP